MRTTKQYGKRLDTALSMWVKLARASATFGKLTAEDIRSYGLTAPQFGVIECLGHLGPLTLGELSRKMLVSCGNTTVVVDNLELEGLLKRAPSSDDRRVIFVDLTAKGRKLFRNIFVRHAEFVAHLSTVLTEHEQEDLARLVKKLGVGLAAVTSEERAAV